MKGINYGRLFTSTSVQCVPISMLVSGKLRHAQGQRLNRFEVRRKRESERTKGEGEKSTLFPLFLTPHFTLNLKVSIG